MSIPNNATGAGNNDAAEVFKVTFSQALSTAPKLEAWDNSSTYPAVDSVGATILKEIFTGTTGNGDVPMLAGYIGGQSGASTGPGASWHPTSATVGTDNPNLLMGDTNYITAAFTPALGEDFVFNLSLQAPYDATIPSTDSLNALLQIRYTHTGTAPTVTFGFNDGGTEGSPSYTTLTSGTDGIRFCNAGTADPVYKLTLPVSGEVYAEEAWVTT